MAEFPFEITLETRFRDVDSMGHVNNAVYVTYLEQARVVFLQEIAGLDTRASGIVIADLSIDYRRPIDLGETVTVGLRVDAVGTSSIEQAYEIRADGDLAATARATTVHVDRESGESVPIPEEWRERIERYRAQ